MEIADICATTEKQVEAALRCYERIPEFYLSKAVSLDRSKNQEGLLTTEKLVAIVNADKSVGLSTDNIQALCEAARTKGVGASDLIHIARDLKLGASQEAAIKNLLNDKSTYVQKAVCFNFNKKRLTALRNKYDNKTVNALMLEAFRTKDKNLLKDISSAIHTRKSK